MSQLEDKYNAQYLAWQAAKTPVNRRALIHALLPVIQQSVIAAGGQPTDAALMAKAKLLALNGLDRYDPEKAALANYMYSHLRGLNRIMGSDKNIIQTPESVILDRQRMQRTENELFDELGRFPSTAEIANKSGLSLKRIAKIRRANVPVTEQQVTTAFGESGAPSVQVLGQDTQQDAWREYVYDSVSDRQKSVMERIYGMHGFEPKSANDVAKELKISPAAVSQQRKKVDELLNSELQSNLF